MSDASEIQSASPLDAPAASVARRRPRVHRAPPADAIHDDARRSISVRINTSDYGRLKAVARRLGVRESDVFRHLLRTGLSRLLDLLQTDASDFEDFGLLVNLIGEFSEDFGMSARDSVAVLSTNTGKASPLDASDLDLIGLVASHPRQAQILLTGLLGRAVEDEELVECLARYLGAKHKGASAGTEPG